CLADTRDEHQVDVVQLVSGQSDDLGGLEILRAGRVDVSDSGSMPTVRSALDLEHLGLGAQLEIGFGQDVRDQSRLRRSLGIIAAAELFAKAAEGAFAELQAKRVGVGLREIAGGVRKWV